MKTLFTTFFGKTISTHASCFIIGATFLAVISTFASDNRTEVAKNSMHVNRLKIVQDTATYYLLGRGEDFQILANIIADPDNFSNNQRKQVLQWIGTRQKLPVIDSTNKAEKPLK